MKQRDLHKTFRLECLFKLTDRLVNKDAVLKMALWVLGKQSVSALMFQIAPSKCELCVFTTKLFKTQQTIYSRYTHSFRSQSCDKSTVSSKATSPQIAI